MDGPYNFGIFRKFPDDLTYFRIDLTVDNLVYGMENATTSFDIGIGKVIKNSKGKNINFEGTKFRIYNISSENYFSVKILDELHPDYENNENWLGYAKKGSNVTIECKEDLNRILLCDYILDGSLEHEDIEVYLPQGWDGLYIGYEILIGGTIEIFINDIIIF